MTTSSVTTEARAAWDSERAGEQLAPGQLFIDGDWSPAESGEVRTVLDPAAGTGITEVAEAGAADVRRATRAARAAFDDGPWAAFSPRERGRLLLRAAEALRERAEAFAAVESLDVGKPLAFTSTVDIPTVIDTFEYYGSLAAGIEGAARPVAMPALAYTRREPIGVVAAITPFNFPLILSATKIAPALAAGNTIVHKPAQETPLTALMLAGVLRDAGLPDGVFNVVTGDGTAGEALLRDPGVDKVAFTGSTGVGRIVARTAAETLKKVTVELGGKGANIIFADADLPAAIDTAIAAFVFNTGQFCMSGSRLLVERPVYEDVLAALGAACPHIPVGDPFSAGTVVGPMAGPRHRAKVETFLDAAAGGTGRPSLIGAALAMELFGHGQDIVDALGLERTHTDRIGHVVWFGTHTRDFGYRAHGFEPPEMRFRFEITAPSGALWTFGPEDAEQRVTGPAVDFCLLVTCRRHRDDVDVKAVGREADRWLGIAQSYPGPAGAGRVPSRFGAS